MNKEVLYNKMHIYHLELMKEVKRICEDNSIDYYLIGGTLLGAVRHKGFIPWDDDADMAIFREDYKRFIVACKNSLNPKFRLDVCFEDNNNFVTIIKIKYKGIRFVEESNSKLDVDQELFIDIFPLDRVSNDYLQQKKQEKNMKKYKFLIYGKYGVPSKNKVIGFIKFIISSLYPCNRSDLKTKYINESTKFNNEKCDYYRVFGSTYNYSKEIIPIIDLKNKVSIKFEDDYFTTFSNYSSYLSRVYGDFMQLPPLDKRYGYKHSTIDIDLN